nr:class I SAM-dependent methyltransferase [Pseudoclavibacter chungangensis]
MALLRSPDTVDDERDVVRLVSRLRAAGHDARLVSAVLTQVRLRRRAEEKFGPFAERMLFTEDGLQQATRLQVAAHHANRFRTAGVRTLADLGCGIGADSLAFASLGFELVAVDADEVTAAVATHNLAMFEDVEVRHGRAEDQDLEPFDGLWFDPARRESAEGRTRRLHRPDDWSPPVDWILGLADEHVLGVKLAPGIDHELLPPADRAETQWVSVDGQLVEATVWAGGAQRAGVGRSALVLGRAGSNELVGTGAAEDVPVAALGAFLHEPDAAVIRSRLIGDLARRIDAHMIAPDIAWMTTDDEVRSPFAQSFRVLEVLPLHVPNIKRELRARGIGRLEIKKRGVDVDPAEFRTRLDLRGDGDATLVLTRVGDERKAILTERIGG